MLTHLLQIDSFHSSFYSPRAPIPHPHSVSGCFQLAIYLMSYVMTDLSGKLSSISFTSIPGRQVLNLYTRTTVFPTPRCLFILLEILQSLGNLISSPLISSISRSGRKLTLIELPTKSYSSAFCLPTYLHRPQLHLRMLCLASSLTSSTWAASFFSPSHPPLPVLV